MSSLTVKAVVRLDEAQHPHKGAKVSEQTSVQQPARWKSVLIIIQRGLGGQCPLQLTAKQQVLKEEMASESGSGGEWDVQEHRLRVYGQRAAG